MADTTAKKLSLVEVLNKMYDDKKEQLHRNAQSIKENTRRDGLAALLGHAPCLICELSLDGRGRAQRAIRVPEYTNKDKTNFRPWHVVWINENGHAPTAEGIQYSHRCNQENCVEPTHGVWESDILNKNRWSCRTCSHVILPDERVIRICTHTPCCIVPKRVTDNDFVDVHTPVQ